MSIIDQNEVWKQIAGYPDYEVSTAGRVRSLKFGKCRVLKPSLSPQGYFYISLCALGIATKNTIHRLVMLAFDPQGDSALEVNHINGVKTDNRLENLEWVTHAGNQKHAYEIGLIESGGNHPHAFLSNERAQEIIDRYHAGGVLQKELANSFNISKQAVSQIIRGARYPNLKRP